jgi:hypothetical protein
MNEQIKVKKPRPYFIERKKVLDDKRGIIGITTLSNVNIFKSQPDSFDLKSYSDFLEWNTSQRSEANWWIAQDVLDRLISFVYSFEWCMHDFKIYIPKKSHPLLFIRKEMVVVVSPYLGYNFDATNENQETEKPKC